ncbi:MAG: phosphatase PAP2 family protein [Spirulinaceae cyanobacterium]
MPFKSPLFNLSRKLIQTWKQKITVELAPLFSAVIIGGLVTAAFAIWGFAEIAEEVLEQETQALDTSILLAIQQIHTPLLNKIVIGITTLGDPFILTILSLVFGVFLFWKRKWADAITLVITAVGALGLNFLLKDLFARERPALWDRIIDVSYQSFPSGHAMISLVIYGFIGYWLMRRFEAWRNTIAIVASVLVITIGFTRLYLGVHWPTDIVAGYAAGLVWLLTCIVSLEIAEKIKT